MQSSNSYKKIIWFVNDSFLASDAFSMYLCGNRVVRFQYTCPVYLARGRSDKTGLDVPVRPSPTVSQSGQASPYVVTGLGPEWPVPRPGAASLRLGDHI